MTFHAKKDCLKNRFLGVDRHTFSHSLSLTLDSCKQNSCTHNRAYWRATWELPTELQQRRKTPRHTPKKSVKWKQSLLVKVLAKVFLLLALCVCVLVWSSVCCWVQTLRLASCLVCPPWYTIMSFCISGHAPHIGSAVPPTCTQPGGSYCNWTMAT